MLSRHKYHGHIHPQEELTTKKFRGKPRRIWTRMEPKEFADEMKAIEEKHKNDPEQKNNEMETLICKVLRQHGYSQGVTIFEKATRY